MAAELAIVGRGGREWVCRVCEGTAERATVLVEIELQCCSWDNVDTHVSWVEFEGEQSLSHDGDGATGGLAMVLPGNRFPGTATIQDAQNWQVEG